MPFDEILGHAGPVKILRAMLAADKVPHAFIFCGPDGIGKRTAAMALAKAVNCLGLDDDFCGTCDACRKIDKQVHPDFFLIEPETTGIKIEQVRALQQDLSFKPLEAKRKIAIIDQAEKMNRQAANCLLKTLEEPPGETLIVLTVSHTSDMLPTVLSRCQRINFSPLGGDALLELLNRTGVDGPTAERLQPLARGSVSRALVLLESDFLNQRAELAEVLSTQGDHRAEAVLALAQQFSGRNEAFGLVLEFLQSWYRDLLLMYEGGDGELLFNGDMAPMLSAALQHETREGILKKFKALEWMNRHQGQNLDVQLGLESILLETL